MAQGQDCKGVGPALTLPTGNLAGIAAFLPADFFGNPTVIAFLTVAVFETAAKRHTHR